MLEKQRRKPHPTEEQIEEARALFEDGWSRLEVSKTTGISIYFLTLYLPDGKWTKVEAGKFAVIRKKENRISANYTK